MRSNTGIWARKLLLRLARCIMTETGKIADIAKIEKQLVDLEGTTVVAGLGKQKIKGKLLPIRKWRIVSEKEHLSQWRVTPFMVTKIEGNEIILEQ